jgi:hypothetical protein
MMKKQLLGRALFALAMSVCLGRDGAALAQGKEKFRPRSA